MHQQHELQRVLQRDFSLSYFHISQGVMWTLSNFLEKFITKHLTIKDDILLHSEKKTAHCTNLSSPVISIPTVQPLWMKWLSCLPYQLHCFRLIRGEITGLCQRKMSMDSGGPTIEDPVATYNETEPQDWGKFTTHSILRWVLFEM